MTTKNKNICYLAAALKNIAITVVIVAGRTRLGHHVWYFIRGWIPWEWGSGKKWKNGVKSGSQLLQIRYSARLFCGEPAIFGFLPTIHNFLFSLRVRVSPNAQSVGKFATEFWRLNKLQISKENPDRAFVSVTAGSLISYISDNICLAGRTRHKISHALLKPRSVLTNLFHFLSQERFPWEAKVNVLVSLLNFAI